MYGCETNLFFSKESTGKNCLFSYSSRGKIWDRDTKNQKTILEGKKITPGYIDLTGSQYREAEGHLKLRSCLQYVVINYALRIGKCINKI